MLDEKSPQRPYQIEIIGGPHNKLQLFIAYLPQYFLLPILPSKKDILEHNPIKFSMAKEWAYYYSTDIPASYTFEKEQSRKRPKVIAHFQYLRNFHKNSPTAKVCRSWISRTGGLHGKETQKRTESLVHNTKDWQAKQNSRHEVRPNYD